MKYYLLAVIFAVLVKGQQIKPKPGPPVRFEVPQGIQPNSKNEEPFKTVSIKSIPTKKSKKENVPWHLDRLDQEDLPLDGEYNYPSTGKGVNVYIISSGIYGGHDDFKPVDRIFGAYSFDESDPLDDCLGFGTHIAGLIGGRTFGVAKEANLHAVKVFNCSGLTPFSSILSAIDWVAENHEKPAVALWLTFSELDASNEDRQKMNAVKKLHDEGITVIVGAGNSNNDACMISPARSPFAITVSGSDIEDEVAGAVTTEDGMVLFQAANTGPCVDIFAPGSNVEGPWAGSLDGTLELSGTNTAPSIVAGVAALVLQNNTDLPPDQVKYVVIDAASKGVLKSVPRGTPNRLASVENLSSPQAVSPMTQSIFSKLQNKITNQSDVVGILAPSQTEQNKSNVQQNSTSVLLEENQMSTSVLGKLYPINMEYTHGGAFTYERSNNVVFQAPDGFGVLRGKDVILAPQGTVVKSINSFNSNNGNKLFLLQVVSPKNYFGPVDVGILDPATPGEFIAITTYQARQGSFVVRTAAHQF